MQTLDFADLRPPLHYNFRAGLKLFPHKIINKGSHFRENTFNILKQVHLIKE